MPGAPILHGYSTSSGPQGEGGAVARGVASAPLNAALPTNWGFFLWLIIIGVIVPGIIIGALNFHGFKFVFRGR